MFVFDDVFLGNIRFSDVFFTKYLVISSWSEWVDEESVPGTRPRPYMLNFLESLFLVMLYFLYFLTMFNLTKYLVSEWVDEESVPGTRPGT